MGVYVLKKTSGSLLPCVSQDNFFLAWVWAVIMGLSIEKESGVLSLLQEYKGFETERSIYSLVQRERKNIAFRMSDLSIKDQTA